MFIPIDLQIDTLSALNGIKLQFRTTAQLEQEMRKK